MSGDGNPESRYQVTVDFSVSAKTAEEARERVGAFLTLAFQSIDAQNLGLPYVDVVVDTLICEEEDREDADGAEPQP